MKRSTKIWTDLQMQLVLPVIYGWFNNNGNL